jgi:cell division protein FtsI/penicillin-binding protein 2
VNRRPRLRGWFIAEQPDYRPRGVWLLLAFAAMALILTVRLVDVQLRQGPHLATAAAQEHAQAAVLHAHRGRILDKDGRLLVSDTPVYSVFADPGVITADQRHVVAAALGPVLGMGPSRLEQLLTGTGRFVYLAHRVSEPTRQRLDSLRLYGVGTIPEEQRVYQPSPVPDQSFAAALLGYVDHDGHGQYGVEAYYDSVLRGTDGKRRRCATWPATRSCSATTSAVTPATAAISSWGSTRVCSTGPSRRSPSRPLIPSRKRGRS